MSRVALVDEETAARMQGPAGPEARRALMHRPEMADAIGQLNAAVATSQLPLRLHELVRYRIAGINGCARCSSYRLPGAAEAGATEDVLAEVEQWRTSEAFDDTERLALDYTERFSLDPTSVDEDLTSALAAALGDDGLVDLTVCIAKYVATGRLITVLDLDQVCAVGEQPPLEGAVARS